MPRILSVLCISQLRRLACRSIFCLAASGSTFASAAVVFNATGGVYSFPITSPAAPNPAVNFTLDWNGDSSPEFSITLANNYAQVAPPEHVNHVLASLGRASLSEAQASYLVSAASPTSSSPAALTLGQLIGPGETFSESSGGALFRGEWKTLQGAAVPAAPGNFLIANSPAYVGARFLISGETKYGWVRLSFSGGSQAGLIPGQATVYGMAYEDTGQPILAGQVSDWLTADFNRDGVVDGADLAEWGQGYDQSADHDANGDGRSDGADFLEWQRQLAKSSFLPAALPTAAAVPEPSGLVISMILAVLVTRFRQLAV